MKILQVVHGFPPESIAGTEIYTYNLSKELSRNHEVFVFYRTEDLSKKEYELSFRESEGLSLFSINNTFRDYSSFESTYLDKRVAEKFAQVLDHVKPDIVHIQHLLYLSARIIEEAKKRNIPVIFTLNDYWLLCPQGQLFRSNKDVCGGRETVECCTDCILYQLGIRKNISFLYAVLRKFTPGWFFQVSKNLYLSYAKIVYLSNAQAKKFVDDRTRFMENISSQVDLFIAPSEFLREKFIAFGIPGTKIQCLPYGFDVRSVPQLPKAPSPVLRFGFIGNLMPAKGVHVLIKSFKGLPAGAAELKIYGKAFSYKSALGNYVGQLRKMVKGSAVKFMGAFNNLEIGKILAEIDVLVVPSLWYENAPLVIQEALLSRTPVIASRIGGIPELVTEGVNGLLFEPGSERDLKEKMESLIQRPLLLNELKREAFKVKTIEAHAKEIGTLYQERVSRGSCENKGSGSPGTPVKTKRAFIAHNMTCIRDSLFAFLFAWISFFPEPVQRHYALPAIAGLCVFFCLFVFDPRYKGRILGRGDWPLWLFLVLLGANIVTASDRNIAWGNYYLLASRLFLLFYIGKGMFSCEKDRNSAAFVICAFSSVVAFLGILEVLFAVNPLYVFFVENVFYKRYITDIVRPMSTLMNPAVLGTYLFLALPFGIYMLKQSGKAQKKLGFCSLVLTGTCLLLTFSRGAVLGAVSMMGLFLWLKGDLKRLYAYGLGLGLLLVVISFLPYPFCRFSIGTLLNGEVHGLFSPSRMVRLEMVLRMLAQSPAFGIGLGHIRLLFFTFYPLTIGFSFIEFEHKIADNMHLTLLAEAGILGWAGFLIFIFFLFKNGFRCLKDISSENSKVMLMITLSVLAGVLVNMTGYELFYWAGPFMFFCLVCGFTQGLIGAVSHNALLCEDRACPGIFFPKADIAHAKSSVSVIVPTCGRDSYFIPCLESLRRQTCPPAEVILVNNSLSAELERKAREVYPLIKIITPDRNLYYGESLNRGIAMSAGDFILCLNDDASLDKDFIGEALKGFNADKAIGMVSGKILRPNRKTLDTTGLFLSAWRTVRERGHGRPDRGQFEKEGFIFGVGGAVAFYRRKMLEEIKEGAFFFDPSFRMFYEDLDLSWRAHNRGWKAYYVPTALACHVRGGSVRNKLGQGKAWARRYLTDEFHMDLIKNRYLAISKNETLGAFCLHLIPIVFYDLCVWCYVLFFKRNVMKIFFSNFKGSSKAFKKEA